jgi:hypothetical protein
MEVQEVQQLHDLPADVPWDLLVLSEARWRTGSIFLEIPRTLERIFTDITQPRSNSQKTWLKVDRAARDLPWSSLFLNLYLSRRSTKSHGPESLKDS